MKINPDNRKYYFVVAGLPDVYLGQITGLIKLPEFLKNLREELHPDDNKKLGYIFLPYDNLNLLNFCLRNNKPWHSMANFSFDQLKSGINDLSSDIPEYLYEFYDHFLKGNLFQEDYIWEYQLNDRFLDYVIPHTEGFLKNWYTFVRDLRNILAALSARYHGFDMANQLIGNNEVTDKLKSSHAHDFNLSLDFPYIDLLIRLHKQGELLELEKQIDFMRWNKIEELTEYSYFSFGKIAGHVLKLTITDKWAVYNEVNGNKIFTDKIAEMVRSFKFSKEFAV